MITKICTVSGKEFVVTQWDEEFYVKMGVPIPQLCPEERMRKRFAWRNERVLYKRKCSGTGKPILSVYSEDHSALVYDQEYYFGDDWDVLDFGRDFDFSKSFFEQFNALHEVVPKCNLIGSKNENSEYVNYAGSCKNCYLLFDADFNEDCCYCSYSFGNTSCFDCVYATKCELCYESVDIINCYEGSYLQNCKGCSNSSFLKNCIACKNCFGCVNLRQKEYYFLNESFSKEVYEEKVRSFRNKYPNDKELKSLFENFCSHQPQRYAEVYQSENSVGDYLDQTKNVDHCFSCINVENCSHVYSVKDAKNCSDLDYFGVDGLESIYNSHVIGIGGNHMVCCFHMVNGNSDMYYSMHCHNNCSDCFGCVGMNHHKYCILNKQYTKEEYEILRDKIIEHMKETGEWGEFFPIEFSPFAYNETMAQEMFPLEKEEVVNLGYRWKNEPSPQTLSQGARGFFIPNNISEVDDSILKEVLVCEVTGKQYRLVQLELDFYRTMGFSVPKLCPEQRHRERMKLRNPRELWNRGCGGCKKEIRTSFAPDRKEEVLCEKCYQEKVD